MLRLLLLLLSILLLPLSFWFLFCYYKHVDELSMCENFHFEVCGSIDAECVSFVLSQHGPDSIPTNAMIGKDFDFCVCLYMLDFEMIVKSLVD